ncbi:MAG TPA: phosphoribosylglycinamide formyltransferase [Xanthobacteraceae bacterium]|jgi:phosphoribosylglycinamide formyltransferase-1|nr:phosphoribosylglycinamide formyltransferase [Xanthobacteraceae bacterium]
MERKRVAILISGRGSNMAALIEAARRPDYPAEIVLVVASRGQAKGLARAREAGIPTKVLEHAAFPDRAHFDRALDELLTAERIALVCLAGYMRLLTPWFVARWADRLLNVHPALLPSFRGLDTHARALAAGVKIHGATVHFVVPEVDAGPIIAQAAVPVLEGDTAETLAARVLAVEHKIYPLALDLVARGCVRIVEGRCIIMGGAPSGPALIVPA